MKTSNTDLRHFDIFETLNLTSADENDLKDFHNRWKINVKFVHYFEQTNVNTECF